jgi:hypothetical protein
MALELSGALAGVHGCAVSRLVRSLIPLKLRETFRSIGRVFQGLTIPITLKPQLTGERTAHTCENVLVTTLTPRCFRYAMDREPFRRTVVLRRLYVGRLLCLVDCGPLVEDLRDRRLSLLRWWLRSGTSRRAMGNSIRACL